MRFEVLAGDNTPVLVRAGDLASVLAYLENRLLEGPTDAAVADLRAQLVRAIASNETRVPYVSADPVADLETWVERWRGRAASTDLRALDAIGIRPGTYSRIRQGRPPSPIVTARIERATGIKMESWPLRPPPPPPPPPPTVVPRLYDDEPPF